MENIIVKKRDGFRLSKGEINYFVKGITDGSIPDYQASAMLMAIYFQGMDADETFELTDAMRYSGDIEDLSDIKGIKVDKHSTGGVGDKTTLIVAPLAASCGAKVAKMSGRGLGFTGGTIDKLESIPGFRTTLSPDEFSIQVNEIGVAVAGQSGHMTPADKKLYALRDVTGTVESRSLIASSIMSKKLASGSDAVVLDVKCGSGGFMKDAESAEELASLMMEIGRAAGKRMFALITNMNEPLGFAVGNALEVREAIEILSGGGPDDLRQISIALTGAMLFVSDKTGSFEDGCEKARKNLENGAGLEAFRRMVERQGGSTAFIDNIIDDLSRRTGNEDSSQHHYTENNDNDNNDWSLSLPDSEAACCPHTSKLQRRLVSDRDGFVSEVDAEMVGEASRISGAGRLTKDDPIDYGAGIMLRKKIGDAVTRGEELAVIYADDAGKINTAEQKLSEAFKINRTKTAAQKLILKVMQ